MLIVQHDDRLELSIDWEGIVANITLFVDESGDFTEKEEWLVSGVAIPYRYGTNNKKLIESTMKGFPKTVGLIDRADFHMTELRQRYQQTGLPREQSPEQIAEALFYRFSKFKPRYITAVGRAGSLNAREETYRLLLQDILWLTQSRLYRDTDVETIDVVVSSRTTNGTLSTDEEDIERDVLRPLQDAVRHGLLSIGMYDLLHHNRIHVHIVQANECWGTVVADFVANIVHNRQHETCGRLVTLFDIELFDSLNKLEERRALVAEADSDFSSALYLWSLVESSHHSSEAKVQAAFTRLTQQIASSRHALAPLYIVDGLIERLHRCRLPNGDSGRLAALRSLCRSLEDYYQHSETSVRSMALALYRLRAYMTLLCARLGQSSLGEQLQLGQPEVEAIVMSEPSTLELLFTNISGQIELKLTMLQYQEALNCAQRAVTMAKRLQEHWDLWLQEMDSCSQASGYTAESTTVVRALGQLHRVMTYAYTPNDVEPLLNIAKTLSTPKVIRDRDRHVLVHCMLKAGQPTEALRLQVIQMTTGSHTIWDVYWLLRAINDVALSDAENRPSAELIAEHVQTAMHQVDHDGTVMSLICRESWLFGQLYPECGLRVGEALSQGQAMARGEGHSAERLLRLVSFDVFQQWLKEQQTPLPQYLLHIDDYPPEARQSAVIYMSAIQKCIDKMDNDTPYARLHMFRRWLPW